MTDQERIPHNPAVEQALLGSLLVDRDAIAELAEALPPEAFYDFRNQTIYRAMLGLWKVRKPGDIVVLSDLLRSRDKLDEVGGLPYLAMLMAAERTAVHVGYYADSLREYAARRAVIDQASALIRDAYRRDVDIDEAVGAIRRCVEPFAKPAEDGGSLYAEAMDGQRSAALDRWDGRLVERVVPTGIRAIDRLIMGGFRGGDLVFVGARPGMGKTSWMLQIAHHAARTTGTRSLVVELEMSKTALMDRAIAAEAGVPFATAYPDPNALMTMEQVERQRRDRERWLAASESLEALPVAVETKLTTTEKIAAYCERLEHKVGAIFVDHLDYLGDRFKADNVEQRTAELTRRCKRLAQQLDCPVIVLAQLNREVEATKPYLPGLRNFRNSGAIEQDTDFAFLLYRRMYYVEKGMLDADDKADYVTASNMHRVEIQLAKNRNGEVRSVDLGWKAETMSFHETRAA